MYPSTLDTPETLLAPVNSWGTEVVVAVSASATEIPVAAVSGLQATGGLVSIDNEVVEYATLNLAGATPILSGCLRGRDGTAAAVHAAGAAVELRMVAAHHNRLAQAILAIESALGIDPGAAPSTVAARLAANLPAVVAMPSASLWTHTHTRDRIVTVQAWAHTGGGVYVQAGTITQTPGVGSSLISVSFLVPATGWLIYQ